MKIYEVESGRNGDLFTDYIGYDKTKALEEFKYQWRSLTYYEKKDKRNSLCIKVYDEDSIESIEQKYNDFEYVGFDCLCSVDRNGLKIADESDADVIEILESIIREFNGDEEN